MSAAAAAARPVMTAASAAARPLVSAWPRRAVRSYGTT
jgi:hypothetical protein